MKRILSLALCLLLLVGSVLPALAATGVPAEVMEATKSVVRIRSEYKRGFVTGSGFVIKNDGSEVLVATNNHVVEDDPQKVQIWVSQDRLVDASIVFAVPGKDLCVLRVTESLSMEPLTLATEEAKHGEAIFAVGYPGAGDVLSDVEAHTSESVTITDGIISAIRTFTAEEGAAPVKLLQINAAINPGNSGGPLFNMQGQVIGVNTYKVNLESQGVFGSVDISELWNLLDQYNISLVEETVPTETATAPTEPVEEKITISAGVLIGGGCAAVAVVLLIVLLIIKKGRKKKAPAETARTLSLQEYMAAYPQGLSPQGAVSLLMGVALQLRSYHNDGRLHLQVSPENIRVSTAGSVLAEPGPQETGRFHSGFAAPEIYRGAGFGIASDVYSFAALLLYAATGSIPGNSLQPEAVEQSIGALADGNFAELIRRAMAPEIQNRLQSVQEMIYGMAPYNVPGQVQMPQAAARKVEQAPAAEAPKAAPEAPRATPKKGRAKPILIAVAAVAVIAVAAGLLLWQGQPGGAEEAQLETAPTATTEGDTAESMAYADAEQLLASGDKARAAMAFGKLGDYKDARARSFALWDEIAPRQTLSAGGWHTVGVCKDGTARATASVSGASNVGSWSDLVAVSAGTYHSVGLKADGTVVVTQQDIAYDFDQGDVDDWTDIVAISAGNQHTVGLKSDGTVVAVGMNTAGQCNVSDWADIVAISAGGNQTVGLKTDGTVVQTGSDLFNLQDARNWTDIVAVSASWHTVGLKSDGTVVAVGQDVSGQCQVSGWKDIIAVSAGGSHTVGLKSDGTLVVVGDNRYGQRAVEQYENVVAMDAGENFTVAICADGKLEAYGEKSYGQLGICIWEWEDIALPGTLKMKAPEKAPEEAPGEDTAGTQEEQYSAAEAMLAAGEKAKAAMAFGKLGDYSDARARSFALWDEIAHRDTVTGDFQELILINNSGTAGRIYFAGLQTIFHDVIAVSSGRHHTLGLNADGTVVSTDLSDQVISNGEDYGQTEVSSWKDIVAIAAGRGHSVGLRSDGTVVAVGNNEDGQCDVTGWEDIIAVSASGNYTLGLKADSTVVAVGDNTRGQCDVGGWTDIVSIETASFHSAGLRSDGTVMSAGASYEDVESWRDVVAISISDIAAVALTSDGALLAVGNNSFGQLNFPKDRWHDLVAIKAVSWVTVGLRSDGTLAVAGSINGKWTSNQAAQELTDIALPGTLKMRAP